MPFNSINFIIFLLLVVTVTSFLPTKVRWLSLLISSLVLYSSWNLLSLVVILYCSLTNYSFGLLINRSKIPGKRKLLLLIDITLSLLPLLTFKYLTFFIGLISSNLLSHMNPMLANMSMILLPIGISFYTFQNISYILDVYRRKIPKETNVGYYLLYSSFFPLQVAGPIERADHLLPQLKAGIRFESVNVYSGLKLILWGYFKKLVIADTLALPVNSIFNNPSQFPFYVLLLGSIFFSFQIYTDFSGYIDIARGVAKIFNIDLSINFNRPYSSRSFKEFWHKWHITLTSWFRDYIYIPLGGNRTTKIKWIGSILCVFTISGLWHGANLNFIIWGLLHGVFYLVGITTSSVREKIHSAVGNPRFSSFIKIITTFWLTSFAWIFFRANTFEDASLIVTRLFSGFISVFMLKFSETDLLQTLNLLFTPQYYLSILLVVLFLLLDNKKIIDGFLESDISKKPKLIEMLAVDIMLVLIVLLGSNNTREFIYMKF